MTLIAAASIFKRKIFILSSGYFRPGDNPWFVVAPVNLEGEKEKEPIYLAHLLEYHYYPIRPLWSRGTRYWIGPSLSE